MVLLAQDLKRWAVTAGPAQLTNRSQPPALADLHVTQDPRKECGNHALLDLTACSSGRSLHQSFLLQTLTKQLPVLGWAGDTVNGPITPSRSIFISAFNPDVSLEPPSVQPPSPWERGYWSHEVLPHTLLSALEIRNKCLFGR